jgi:hypothetical protein
MGKKSEQCMYGEVAQVVEGARGTSTNMFQVAVATNM